MDLVHAASLTSITGNAAFSNTPLGLLSLTTARSNTFQPPPPQDIGSDNKLSSKLLKRSSETPSTKLSTAKRPRAVTTSSTLGSNLCTDLIPLTILNSTVLPSDDIEVMDNVEMPCPANYSSVCEEWNGSLNDNNLDEGNVGNDSGLADIDVLNEAAIAEDEFEDELEVIPDYDGETCDNYMESQHTTCSISNMPARTSDGDKYCGVIGDEEDDIPLSHIQTGICCVKRSLRTVTDDDDIFETPTTLVALDTSPIPLTSSLRRSRRSRSKVKDEQVSPILDIEAQDLHSRLDRLTRDISTIASENTGKRIHAYSVMSSEHMLKLAEAAPDQIEDVTRIIGVCIIVYI